MRALSLAWVPQNRMVASGFLGTANAMKPIVKLLLIVPILLWSSVAAADFRAGVDAYMRGDYATAYKELLPLVEQGHADAQFFLGSMYLYGEGVPEDDAAAVKWLRKAAEQGQAEAQFLLGVLYADGEGVPEDDAAAVKWLRKAAEQGLARAQFNLGVMYAFGEGVPEDYVRAFAWFNLAAAQGDAPAKKYKGSIRQSMTAAQIADAQELSASLLQRIRK